MNKSTNSICEDTYFLDRDLAYQTALAHNPVQLTDGQKCEQVCYYDGPPFLLAPDNLINVPADQFREYFAKNPQRLPKKIDTTITQTEVMPIDLNKQIQGMMTILSQVQRSSSK
ncbi:hypothetical protein [Kaarinaea lacus]